MSLDSVTSPFKKAWELIQRDPKVLFIDFAKIYLLTFLMGTLIGGLIIAAAFALGIGTSVADILSQPPLLAAIAVIGGVLFIAVSIITTALTTTMYSLVEARDSGRTISIIGTAKGLIPRIAKYLLVVWGAMLLMFLPGILVFGLAISVEGLALLALITPLLFLLSVIVYIIFAFLVQFAIIELALKGKGAVESLKASAAMARRNWLTVLGFDILVFLVSLAIGIASSVVQQVFSVFAVFGLFNPAIILLVFLIYLVIVLITTIATAMVTVPSFYYFWRDMK